jgi:hypothetical protein
LLALTWGVVLLLALTPGCFVARTHARVEPGWEAGIAGGGHVIPPRGHGHGSHEELTGWKGTQGGIGSDDVWLFAQIDLQYGLADDEEAELRGAWAFQAKLNLALTRSVLDVYRQFPTRGPWYWGVGGEVGLVPGLYMPITYAPGSAFVTLTLRAGIDFDEGTSQSSLAMQLAGGLQRGGGGYLFAAWWVYPGAGVDTSFPLFSADGPGPHDARRHFLVFGIGGRT